MATQEEPLFIPASFFMCRASIRPIEDFFALSKKASMQDALLALFMSDPVLREALAIASPTLYEALNSQKDGRQITSSLLKYFSRMCSRATPFGLFSFVSLGYFEQRTAVSFDLTNLHKRARPDMDWLLTVINKICAVPELFTHLSIRTNSLAYETAGRVFLSYIRKEQKADGPKKTSIRASFLIQAIFEKAKLPVSIGDLTESLLKTYPELEKEKVLGVLKQLVLQQYLSFTLLPTLLTLSPFHDLIAKLSFLPHSYAELYEIAQKIATYNLSKPGQGEAAFKQIQDEMQKCASVQNKVQVDTACLQAASVLPESVAKEFSEAAEVLWKLSATRPHPSPLHSYYEKFLEKYGIYRLVPLLEVISEAGLGIPESYLTKVQEQSKKEERTSKWTKWIRQEWMTCVREKKHEIVLTDETIEHVIGKTDKKKALLSFDLFCEIIANSAADIEREDYLLLISAFSWQAGATFGRFLDLLGEKASKELRALYEQEEALEQKSVFAQTSFTPHLSRLANVSTQPNLRKLTLDLGGPSDISLEDIYVGASDRLYLTVKNCAEELVATTGNLLNPTEAPTPIRFIQDVSLARHQLLYSFPWMDVESAPFLPRVRYKKVVLAPAEWKIDLLQLGLKETASLELVAEKFTEWAHRWALPRYCFVGEGDQRILMDCEHPTQRQELAQLIKKGLVSLVEKIGQDQGQWVKSQQGSHIAEFIVPFVKNIKYCEPQKGLIFPKAQSVSVQDRWKLPGSEWLYLKLYLDPEQENRFLTDYSGRFVALLLKKCIITDWFFVRYGDPKPHLRLRFRGESACLISQLIPALHDWTQQLIKDQIITEMQFSSYEREVERYGGESLIENAEALFHADSAASVMLINGLLGKKIPLHEEVVAALSLIDLLKNFGLNAGQQLQFFQSHHAEKSELKGFREHKSSLVSLSLSLLQTDSTPISEELFILNSAFQRRGDVFKAFSLKMHELEKEHRLATPPPLIIDSILHMHCNRLLGRERRKEIKARLFAQHTLAIIQGKEKFGKSDKSTVGHIL